MNRRNYARELDRITAKNGENKPTLLLHACCGPCSSSVTEFLVNHFQVTVLWYNPNLYPEEEFEKRYSALTEILDKMGLRRQIPILSIPWNHESYLQQVQGLEDEPEGGKRCEQCFRLRLMETARIAKEYQFDYFCTTLTVSRHKDAVLLNAIGEEMGSAFTVNWLPSDFKKRNGENRSQELSEKYGIYRQLYCGCEFSLNHRNTGKPGKEQI